MLKTMQRKGNPSTLLMGMQIGAATVENGMEFPQKTKNETRSPTYAIHENKLKMDKRLKYKS